VYDTDGSSRLGISYPVVIPSNFGGLIATGFPIHESKPDRFEPPKMLRNVNGNMKLLFVISDNDAQADMDAMNKLAKHLKERVDGGWDEDNLIVHLVEGGGHGVFRASKRDDSVVEVIREFLDVKLTIPKTVPVVPSAVVSQPPTHGGPHAAISQPPQPPTPPLPTICLVGGGQGQGQGELAMPLAHTLQIPISVVDLEPPLGQPVGGVGGVFDLPDLGAPRSPPYDSFIEKDI